MRKLQLFAAFAAFCLPLTVLPQTPDDPTDRGSALYADCLASVRQLDGLDGKDAENQSTDNTFASTRCISFVEGFTDATVIESKVICSKGVTLGTVIRVHVLYMQKHPKVMDLSKDLGLVFSLAEAYPCSK